jgi:ribosomal-protein-alanine N-acetyltransferase
MPVVISSAELVDLPAIMQIERSSPLAAHWTTDQYKLLLDSGFVFVAEELLPEEGGILRGFLCAKCIADTWEIENIAVDAAFQRQGIAYELLRHCIQRARSGAVVALHLEVRESNQAARRLYEKQGFREQGRRRAYYLDPVDDAILYNLELQR